MGLLNQVVTTGRGHNLDVLHAVEHRELAKGGAVTPELVRVHDVRHVVFPQQSVEERFGRLTIAVFLKENVQHTPVLIDCSPQPVLLNRNSDYDLVQMPDIVAARRLAFEAAGVIRTKLQGPLADSLVDEPKAQCDRNYSQTA